MAHHDQRTLPRKWSCDGCFKGKDCGKCIEVARQVLMAAGHIDPAPPICQCTKQQHAAKVTEAIEVIVAKGQKK